MIDFEQIREATARCLVRAGTGFRAHQTAAYRRALALESDPRARWVIEGILENARVAEESGFPLCDDTGIPHVFIDLGQEAVLPAHWLSAVKEGVAEGLRLMPGRPMAVRGDDQARIEQTQGLHDDPARMLPAPLLINPVAGSEWSITVLLLGGGPEIRAKTHRVFHRRSAERVLGEAADWIAAEVGSLGCTPAVLAVGVGRSHFEASALMLEAMKKGSLDKQNEWENWITERVNRSGAGPLGLGGSTTALGTLLNIGPQRASGVRIVCVRPCCCFEPRRASVVFTSEGRRWGED
ncbi:MAG: fumarate hydratase [Deltaproteobacteria bacterium]|nr:fumarate hydratase [Deltaproteobacteria bacterium]